VQPVHKIFNLRLRQIMYDEGCVDDKFCE